VGKWHLGFNWQRDAEGEPFFVTIWFHEPHGPVHSHPKLVERYAHLEDPSLQQYLANISQIDEAVGTIVDALKAADVYDDTLIWYTSDNGPEGAREPEGRHSLGTFNQTDSAFDASRYRGSSGGLIGRKRDTHEGSTHRL
jgi:arylsulfatase A-like enzyme